jgi:hypothetical protein
MKKSPCKPRPDTRTIEQLANISPREYAALDRMIAECVARDGQDIQVSMRRTLDQVRIIGLQDPVRLYFFSWAVGDKEREVIGWRAYGADEQVAAFQAVAAKYVADGVKAKSVILHTPSGTEKLR